MGNELVVINGKQLTSEELNIVTSTIAKDATPEELKLFLYRCQNMGLDPLKPGQIHFVKYGKSAGSIVVGIEGFRVKAHRSGKLAGIKRGAIRDAKGALVGGWAEVYRTDWKEPAREECPLSEYKKNTPSWSNMPETMIKKCAEAAALRMAFPDDLGGVYINEEMGIDPVEHKAEEKAILTTGKPAVLTTGKVEGAAPAAYKIDFGKHEGASIREIYEMFGKDELTDYVAFLENSAAKKNEQVSGRGKRFIDEVEKFLGSIENAPIEEGNFDFEAGA